MLPSFVHPERQNTKKIFYFPLGLHFSLPEQFRWHSWDKEVFVFQFKTVAYLLRRVHTYNWVTYNSFGGKTYNPLSQCLLLRLLLPSMLLASAIRQIILYSFYKSVHVKFVQATLPSTCEQFALPISSFSSYTLRRITTEVNCLLLLDTGTVVCITICLLLNLTHRVFGDAYTYPASEFSSLHSY